MLKYPADGFNGRNSVINALDNVSKGTRINKQSKESSMHQNPSRWLQWMKPNGVPDDEVNRAAGQHSDNHPLTIVIKQTLLT